MLKNILPKNPISYFLFLVTIIVLASLTAFYIASLHPESIGMISPRFIFREVYRGEYWSFQLYDYRINLPAGNIVMPVFLEDQFTGIVIKESSGYVLDTAGSRGQNFSGGFLAISSDVFMDIKKDTLLLPLEDSGMKTRLVAPARQLINLPKIEGLGYTRIFLPPGDLSYIYLENDGRTVVSHYPDAEEKDPFITVYFSLLFLVTALLIKILTLDLHPSNALRQILASRPSGVEILLVAAIIPAIFVLESYSGLTPFDSTISPAVISAYYSIFILLFFLAHRGVIAEQSFGLTRKNILRSLVLSSAAVFIITIFSALKFPSGFINTGAAYTGLIKTFSFCFIFSLGRELFWRGYFQTVMERLLGKWSGITATVAVITMYHFSSASLNEPQLLESYNRLLEIFFFVPGTAFLLSFIYLRSRNILSCSLLQSMLLFLPQVLVF